MNQNESVSILVTGERENSFVPPQALPDGRKINWTNVPVLRFERLEVDPALIQRLVEKPVDWILFSSPRAVEFWSQVILESGVDFPLETQVACIGEQTADAASQVGFNADFYPTEPGTECFLTEFEDMISNNSAKPTVFIPQAEEGRTTITDRLKELGCEVIQVPLYRTLAREDVRELINESQVENASLIVFTSPSSFDAFSKNFKLPSRAKVGALGKFTAAHLSQKGIGDGLLVPEGDFSRIGELLC